MTRPELDPCSDPPTNTNGGSLQQQYARIQVENEDLTGRLRASLHDLEETLEHQAATRAILGVISGSPSELQKVLETLAGLAAKLCESMSATVFLREGDTLTPQAQIGPFLLPTGEAQRIHSAWVTGHAVLQGRPVHVPDLLDASDYPISRSLALQYGHRTVLAVPMMSNGEAIGALLVRRGEVRPLAQKHITLLETFADQAVIAIENARLFEQVQARTAELSASLEELRAAQDRLVQTQKLAALGQLTAGVAHEIKNPLNFINNFADLSADLIEELETALKPPLSDAALAEATELASTVRANLRKVVEHGRRADAIVKNMLLHSREGSGERRTVDLNATAQECLNLAYHGARAEDQGCNVRLTTALDPNTPFVDVYPQELVRVLLNLLSNAIHAVQKRRRDDDDASYVPEVTVSTRSREDQVVIRVHDNGAGMSDEVRARIFDPFFTTKPPGEGTGLGLSLSHDIVVKQHGGTIGVHSKVGEFSEFVVTLPRRQSRRDNPGAQP